MVSNIFYFHPYLGKIPNLINIFHMGWNHQLVNIHPTVHPDISLYQCALSGASPLHGTVSQQLPLDWLGTGPSYPGGTTIMVLFATSVVGGTTWSQVQRQYFSTSQGGIVGGPSPKKGRNSVRLSGQFFGIWSFKRGKSYLDAYHCLPATWFFSWGRTWLVLEG